MHVNHDWAFVATVDLGCPKIEAQAVFADYCGCTTMEHKRLFIPVREILSLAIETSGVLDRTNLTILQSTTNSGPGFRTGRRPEALFTSGASAIGHAFENVHAFRRKPRIFPAVVSATVLSEAITLLFPQLVAANALGEASGLRCASALRDKMAEPVNAAPAVATLQRNERRSLEYGASWRPS